MRLSVEERLKLLERDGLLGRVEDALDAFDVSIEDALGFLRLGSIWAGRNAAMAMLYGRGKSTTEIGRYFGRDASTVRESLMAVGVTLRSRRGAKVGTSLGQALAEVVHPSPSVGNDSLINAVENASNTGCSRSGMSQLRAKEERRPGLATRRLAIPEVEMTETVTAAGDGCKANDCAGVA